MAADANRFAWSVLAVTVGAVLVVAVAGPTAGAAPAIPLAWLLFVGSSMHVAATLALFSFQEVRGYTRRNAGRYLVTPTALLAGAVTRPCCCRHTPKH